MLNMIVNAIRIQPSSRMRSSWKVLVRTHSATSPSELLALFCFLCSALSSGGVYLTWDISSTLIPKHHPIRSGVGIREDITLRRCALFAMNRTELVLHFIPTVTFFTVPIQTLNRCVGGWNLSDVLD